MTAPRRPRPRSLSRKGWERLLDLDLFGKVRTEDELASLVLQAARHAPTPYTALVTALLGRPGLAEAEARALWIRAVDHRRGLAEALGRPVHLRVAALDLVLREGDAPPPVILDRGLVRTLVVEASSDPLTGLTNRRQLVTVLEHELRQRHRPAVAVLDIDGFKQVNDTLGHSRGDEVLRGLAAILRESRRKGDVAARLGGDEFALVLVDASLPAATAVLERVEAAFARAFGDLGVGLSRGLVQGDEQRTPAEVLEAADRLMYQAKRRRARPATGTGPPLFGLYASGHRERFHRFHQLLAGHGLLLLPARTAEVARRLAPVLAPRLLLADHLLPPRGGAELLAALGPSPAGTRRFLVAPERWRGVSRGAPDGLEVLPYPPSAQTVDRLVERLGPGARSPGPSLASEEEAGALQIVVERLARGEVGPDGSEAMPGRPELDHLRRLLGT